MIISRAVKSNIGTREGLGFFRSSMEANYARYLNFLKEHGEIIYWYYEATEFRFPVKRGNVSYRPDFQIINKDGSTEFHEVKGWMDKDSRVKLKRMAKYYPADKLIVIDKKAYKAIEKKAKFLIKGWE